MLQKCRGVFFAGTAALALLLAGPRTIQAQDAVIRGTITSDRGEPVVGANVLVEELRMGVLTNAQGQYTVLVPGARVRGQQIVLRVRAIGFKPNSKAVTLTPGEQAVDLVVSYDVNLLEAIVVTGTQEATEAVKVPFTVSRVDAEQLPVPASNPLTQLQGKVPGANIVSASGRPGAQPSVLLRGPTSINASGRGQDPLYIVDGVMINSGLPDLNPQDIENVEVVKGAAGASLYGARAGNGVINITTKSARRSLEGVKFGLRSEAGVGDIERDFGLARFTALATDESGAMFCEAVTGQPFCARTFDWATEAARINDAPGDFSLNPKGFPIDPGSTISGPALGQRFQVQAWPGTSYNAVNQLVTPKPFFENTLDITGRFGTQTRFYASASNRHEEGAIRYLNGFTRNAFRINVDQGIGTDWNLSFRTSYTRSTQDGINQEEGGNAFFRLTRVPAIANILQYDTLGRLYIRPNLQGGGSQNQNPLSTLYQTHREDVINRFIGGLTATYSPVNWFNLDANFSYDLRRGAGEQINDKGFRTTAAATGLQGNGGSIQRGTANREAINGSVNASFKRDFGPDLKTRYNFRYLFEQRDYDTLFASGSALSVKGVTDIGNTSQPTRNTTSNSQRVRQVGVFGGVNLDYKSRYIVDALIRRDGSSLFGPENRWATFGRGSVAWRVAQEPWWSIPSITELKLHGSYGTAGGSPRFDAQYEVFNVGTGGLLSMVTLGNSQLKPELHKETEFGADLELWNRYAFNITYSHARIEDQILPVPVSASTGFQRRWLNAGELTNKTLEMSLNIPLMQRRDVQWSARFIYDRNRSVVTALDVPPFFFGADLQGTGSIFQAKVGERLGTFYGHRFITNCSELSPQWQSRCGPGSDIQANDEGLLVWVGAGNNPGMGITNNLWDTRIDNTARDPNVTPWGIPVIYWGMPILLRDNTGAAQNVALGNALPDFRFAVTQDLRYKKFNVYALVDAAVGQKVWNQGFHWAHLDFLSHDVDQVGKSVQDAKPIGYYWRTSPADGFTGRGGFYDQLAPNSYTVEDGSYAKLRELLVSYRLGPIAGTGDWEVAVVGRNLWTITGYRGFDPEVGLSGGNQLNGAASGAINAVDAFTFPNLRTFTFGLSSTF
ncbi:MAG TPA: SusC/RagA family TonB-linked outer membrane protein [Gemmatimonadales bacterium]|nr:SusC/RagA family TonB-linked outer membrane protein [Gemmatimonadales bacterium]